MVWLILMLIILVLGVCLWGFFRKNHHERQYFSVHHFYSLVLVYFTVMIGFGLLYFVLSSQGWSILQDELLRRDSVLDRMAHSIYFSGVTLMTVGYGDITPIGIGRVIALSEALIGYILPAAFFVQLIQDKR